MRARNIKPGFFENESLADLGPYAQILFEGLWCLADREGKLEDRPRRIQSKVFPFYDPDPGIEELLEYLEKAGFIDRYTVDEIKVIKIIKFLKHQRPHKTEKNSELPEKSTLNNGESTLDNGECTLNNGESTLDNGECTLDNVEYLPDSLIHRFTDSLNPEKVSPDGDKSIDRVADGPGTGVDKPIDRGVEGPDPVVDKNISRKSDPGIDGGSDKPEPELGRSGSVVHKFLELWNEAAPDILPRARVPTSPAREKAIRAVLKIKPDLEFWRGLVVSMGESPFLCGDNDRRWVADIDFLLRKWLKIAEGAYRRAEVINRPRVVDLDRMAQAKGG
ncbi:MAG: hypothetical protein AB1585_10675 [Thermodesulfobacteriota bacterium]